MNRKPNLYMGAEVELTTCANGAITHAGSQRQLARSMYLEPTVERVAPGVTVFGGDGFLNLTLIEGDDGLIVYDTGETLAEGERFLAQIRQVSSKPIVAILYSHSHYVHGSQALVGNGEGVAIIGHPSLNSNLADGATGTTFAETSPLQTSRLLQQFNHYVPRRGEDAAAGAEICFGKSGLLPVNLPVHDGQRLTVAGVPMQFFTRHGSDTDDCLTVHLSDRDVVLNNILLPFLPNIYTLRGSKYRDPREWRDALQQIVDLKPAVLVNTHARAVVGRQASAQALEHVIDALNLVLDQSLRGILLGMGPDELRSFVALPPALSNHPNLAEIYGEVSHFGPYIHHHAIGWFDGDAASINPLPPREQAVRLVQAMAGREPVLAQAEAAMQRHEYAWACQLVNYLYQIDPLDSEVRLLKARALQAMGRVTPAHTVRSWYMTQAAALRGEIQVPRLQFASPKVLALSPPAASMDQYRVRVEPLRAGESTLGLDLQFPAPAVQHGWRLRRGTARFVRDIQTQPAADVVLKVAFEDWLLFFSGRKSLDEFLAAAEPLRGAREQAAEFFALFDFYAPQGNHVVPPLSQG